MKTSRTDNLLVIGAGIGQVPLVKKAKSKGIKVTVASIPGDYPCFELSDDMILRDIYDREGIVREARKRNITAVISDQNDLVNPTVAYVAEALGLPGNHFDTVMTYCNKNSFKDLCDRAGVPVPGHLAVSSDRLDLIDIPFSLPWVVKPADSQSSIGVKKVETKEEALKAINQALMQSPAREAIIEEYVQGKEIVCEGFICDGKYYLLSFGDRLYFNLPDMMIPSQTLFPSKVDQKLLSRVKFYEESLTERTRPAFAIVHSEYIVNEESEKIWMIESALRGGGVYISSDLIPLATGIDINELLLCKALGREIDVESIFKCRKDCASGYACFYLPEGEIVSIKGKDELLKYSFIHKACINRLQIGDKTSPMTYKGARLGPILIKGNTREELEDNIRRAQAVLDIQVKDSQGIISGIKWT